MKATPFCRYLRTKKMFIPALADEIQFDAAEAAHSSHCWCNRTLTETGPDEQPVTFQVCTRDRSCFEE